MTTLRAVLSEARAKYEADLGALDAKYHAERKLVVDKLDAVHRHVKLFDDELEEDFDKVKDKLTISLDWLKKKL